MAEKTSVRIKVPCVICHPKLATPVENYSKSGKEFAVQVRIPKTDEATIEAFRAAMKQVCVNACGENKEKWPFSFRGKDFFETNFSPTGQDGFPLRDGDAQEKDYYHGHVFFSARSSKRYPKPEGMNEEAFIKAKANTVPQQPQLGKMVAEGRWVKLTGSRIEEELYSGAQADVVLDLYWNDKEKTTKGVCVSLKAVMKTGDGERFGGGEPVNMGDFFGEEGSSEELDAGDDDLSV